ncbi:MAG: HupE/UreJ family protein [Verrucomicrobiota bacterium]
MKKAIASILIFACAFQASAHDPGLSTLKLQHEGDQIRAVLIFSPRDLETVIQLDENSDGAISTEELSAAKNILEKMSANFLAVSLEGKLLTLKDKKWSLDENSNFQFDLNFSGGTGSVLKVVSKFIELLPPGHRQFVSFQEGTGSAMTEDLLDAGNNIFTINISPAQTPIVAKKTTSFSDFFVLGVRHILTGYDHLLFLFALLIVCESFGSVAKIVTCFTLAHSLTLALATLDVVQIPSRIIEPIIAASIVYVGMENIFCKGHPKGRWLLTFAFGLVHGFGFAGVLREMEIAQSASVAIPLVSFNLGVEAGQIAVAAILLPVLWRVKRVPKFAPRWVPACSALVAVAGAYWFIQRVWF